MINFLSHMFLSRRLKADIPLTIRFRRLHPDAKIPRRGSDGAAGYDLTGIKFDLIGDDKIRYYTGIAVEIPSGYVGLGFPRSSIYKTDLRLCNAVAVIDSDYRGEITFVFDRKNLDSAYLAKARIGQLVIVPVPEVRYIEVAALSETARGTGGYGSTGK